MHNSIIIALALTLSACSTTVHARVSAFHTLESDREGRTFAVLPYAWQVGSLEFQSYAQRVTEELVSNGFQPAPLERAQLVVFLDYAIDSGHDTIQSYPIMGQTGVSSAQTSATLTSYGNIATYSGTTTYTPTQGVVASGLRSRLEYNKIVRLDILEKAPLEEGTVTKVYEGEAISTSNVEQLSAVVPTLLQGLFRDFPGKSGQSKKLKLWLEQ